MTALAEKIADNLSRIRDRIAGAAARSGRRAEDVRLVAVTKAVEIEHIRALVELGQTDIGENRVQALVQRADALADLPIRWHMIGHLQRNKVRPLLGAVSVIHSVDSERLALEIEKRAAAEDLAIDCLIEVNVSGEEAKWGIDAEDAEDLVRQIAPLAHVRLRGLMTMAPFVSDAETVRPVFAGLRQLLASLNEKGVTAEPMTELSMGMTQDFEVAVEEGATIVRIGTALFR
ncbi:MAG: YggS family pyridoxal phosphate-dependent enzyme [Planctomycetia bacterium]|nr:YggS family pyridoxal phosphate-dependent enzyme [Planctomycetia bacterium]